MNAPPQGQRRVVRVKRATPVAKQLEEAIRSPGPERGRVKEDTAAGGIPSPITAESTQTTSAGTDEDLADLPGSEQPQDKPQREPTADENPTDEPTEVPKSEPPRGEDRPESTVARPRRKRPVLPSAHKPEKPDLETGNAGARRFPVPPRKEVAAIRPVRITTYLRRDVHDHVRRLYRDGTIVSITALVNAALRSYLEDYYGIET